MRVRSSATARCASAARVCSARSARSRRAATLARRVWRLSPISHTVAKMTMLLAIDPIVTSQRAVRSTIARPTAVKVAACNDRRRSRWAAAV